MKLIRTDFGYNFWTGIDSEGKMFYNVTPIGQLAPSGGYYAHEFICHVKNVPNCFI